MNDGETRRPVGTDRRDTVAGVLLMLSLPLLVAGLTMPALSITRMVFFTDTYSIAGAVFLFWSGGRYLLFAVVFMFSLVFPSAKIVIGLLAWGFPGREHAGLHKGLAVIAALSKWSMLDVFIIALTVLALEGSLFATTDIHPGVVLFAAAVILSTLAMQRLERRLKV